MGSTVGQYPNGTPPEQVEVPNPPVGSIDPQPPANLDENRASQFPDGLPPEQAAPPFGGGGGVSDHGELDGLDDNDHPQYPLKSGDETISGLWNFTAVPTVLGQPVFYPGNLDPNTFALKTTTLTSGDPQTLGITGGNLGVNSVFTPVTNIANALLKLNAQGKIPPTFNTLSGLNPLGVYNNSGANSGLNPSEAFPGNTYAHGDFYSVGEDSGATITLKDRDTGLDYEQAVDPGDFLFYIDQTEAPSAPATGWYWVERTAVTSAASVLYSQSTTVLTGAANVQAALEELSTRAAFIDRPATVTGLWNFTTAPTIGGSTIWTAANHAGSGDPHPQYPLNAGAESISGLWDFTTAPTIGGSAILTAASHGSTGDPHTQYALDSLGVTTTTPQTLTVGSATLGGGVSFGTITNVAEGLLKLNATGVIPPSFLPLSGLNPLGIYNNSGANSGLNPSEAFPGNTYNAGDFYIVGEDDGTTITLKDADTGADYEQAVNPGDFLIYGLSTNGFVPATGWYYIERTAVTSADSVLYDQTGTPWTGAANVQDFIEEVGTRVTLRDRTEAINAQWNFNTNQVFRDPAGTSTVMNRYLSFRDGAEVERGWIGFGGVAADEFDVANNIGAIGLRAATNILFTTGGNLWGSVNASGGWQFIGSFVFGTNTATYTGIGVNASAGADRELAFRTAGANRWVLRGASSEAESGANAGSNFQLLRYDDAGNFIATTLQIQRASGAFTHYGSAATFNDNDLYLQGGGSYAQLHILGGPGNGRQILFRDFNSGSNRWIAGVDGTAEGGANAGSDFRIERYNDSGVYLGRPFYVRRSDGYTEFQATSWLFNGNYLTLGGNTAGIADFILNAAAGTGRIWNIQSGGSLRWQIGTDGAAESGSNAGTEFIINRCDDSGAFLGRMITFFRNTGEVVINSGASQTGSAGLSVVGAFGHVGTQANIYPGTGVNYEFVNRNGGGWQFFINNASAVGFACTAAGEFVVNGTTGVHGIPGLVVNGLISAVGGAFYAYPGANPFQFVTGGTGGEAWEFWVGAGNSLRAFRIDPNASITFDSPFFVVNLGASGGASFRTSAAGSASVIVGSPTGFEAHYRWDTAGFPRWYAFKDSAAESGGNAGSNFAFGACDDAGTYVGPVYTINRATRVMDFAFTPTVGGIPLAAGPLRAVVTAQQPTTSVAAIAVPGLSVNLAANATYKVRVVLRLSKSNATGYGMGMNAPNSVWAGTALLPQGNATASAALSQFDLVTATPTAGVGNNSTVNFVATLEAIVQTTIAEAASALYAVTGSGTLIAMPGSYIEAERLF